MMRYRSLYIVVLVLVTLFSAVAEEAKPEAQPAPAPAPPPAPVDIRQVQVQVWISETNEKGLRNIGANLDYTRFVRQVEQQGSVQQVTTNLFDPSGDFSQVTLPSPSAPSPNSFNPILRPDEDPRAGVQTRQGAGMTFSIINSGYGTIDGAFRATEDQVDVDLISKPELLVVNAGLAEIKAGGQVPYQTVQYTKGVPNLSVAWRDIGVVLKLQASILPSDFVQLHLQQLEVSDINSIENLRGVDLPVFSKRSQTGFVQVPNGQTLVIGGLSSRVVRKTERRVPILGRVPVLGMPFRHRRSDAEVTHLLVFVSPTIVDLRAPSKMGASAMSFWRARGSEWANADRIDNEVRVMQDEL